MGAVSVVYRRMTYLLVISTFFLMLLGGYVKAIGAGLSCPDWPLCYGKVFPFTGDNNFPYSHWQIFVEWFHRLWAAVVGIILILVVFFASRYRKSIPSLFNLGLLCLILFIVQIIFGALTVIEQLDPLIVVAHLGNAIAIIMIQMSIAFLATVNSNGFVEKFNQTV